MIRNEEYFNNATWSIRCPHCNGIIGFDGKFDWDWIFECFPRGIMPMDFDGVIEINQHYLILESKNTGTDVPLGQRLSLSRIHKAKSFVVMVVWGKDRPEYFQYYKRNGELVGSPQPLSITNREHIIFVRRWANAADGGLLD